MNPEKAAEIKAAIAKAEAAGRTDLADKLRAYLPAEVTPERIKAAADKARAAGRADLADKLMAKLPAPAEDPLEPPRVEDQRQARIDAFAAFEMANPGLVGRYTPDNFPQAGESVMGTGGGGRSGGARVTVQPSYVSEGDRTDTFGGGAAAMMEGPVDAMQAFGTGLVDTARSPSYAALEADPYMGQAPSAVNAALSKFGDLGGAALSALGAGVGGAAGLAMEAVPGLSDQGEGELAQSAMLAAQFAAPELAGVSSVGARAAGAGTRAARAAPGEATALAGDVAAAERAGIPVFRSDVAPPESALGKSAQRATESIPFGMAGPRAAQQEARIAAAKDLVVEFGGDAVAPAIDDVAASVLAKREADLKRYSGQKARIVEAVKGKGPVPVPSVVAEIDKQIAAITEQRLPSLEPVIAKLREFRDALVDQPLDVLEKNRKAVGEVFADPGLASIRDAGEKALSAIYAPLKKDIAAFVNATGGPKALAAWNEANGKLSALAGDLKDVTMRAVLQKGEATPETVARMLFSAKPSDVARLAKSLTKDGMASARAAIIQKAVGSLDSLDDLSPERFRTALRKLGPQIDTFFTGPDLEAVRGLQRALRLTQQASKSVAAPLTGVQNMPGILGLFFGGTLGIVQGAAAAVGVGQIARVYERTGVQAALRRLAKAETPQAQAAGLSALRGATSNLKAPAAAAGAQDAANANQRPAYEALWGRY
jgi:hypothetical protein